MQEVDIELLLQDYLTVKGRRGEQIDALCPFHKDTRPSFTVNLQSGKWKCFAPDCEAYSGGEFKDLLTKLKIENTSVKFRKSQLNKEDVIQKHEELLLNESVMHYLKNHCGYTLETIQRFKLGWDGGRIQIPIFEGENLVNIRRYSPAQEVKMLGIRGLNKPRIFPLDNMTKEVLYLCAGEKDTMLANQLGLSAITITSAEGIIPLEYIPLFNGKTVYIIHDVDDAGDRAIRKYVNALRRVAKKMLKVTLPVVVPNKDLTDYIVKERHTIEDLLEVIDKAKPLSATDEDEADKIPIPVTLQEIKDPQYYWKNLEFVAIIVGKDFEPYIVPRKVEFSCPNAGSIKTCKNCLLLQDSHQHEYTIQDIIRFINTGDKQLFVTLLEIAKMPGCKCIEIKNLEMVSLSSVQMETPISSETREDIESVSTAIQGYVLNSTIDANQAYRLIGKLVVDAKTQQSTVVIFETHHTHQDIDDFKLEEEWTETLQKIFSVN